MTTTRDIWSGLVASLLLACSGTETGNPGKTSAALSLAAHSSSSSVIPGPGSGGIHVESAWLKVSSIARTTCDGQSAEVAASSFVVDLLSSSSNLPAFDLGLDAFCMLQLEPSIEVVAPDAAPPELVQASIVLTGTRDDEAPFVVATPTSSPIILQTLEPFDPTAHQAVLMAFDLGIWFSMTGLDQVAPDDQGTVRLDGVMHPSTVVGFDAQLAPGAGLFPDLDQDGVLDEDELQAPLAEH